MLNDGYFHFQATKIQPFVDLVKNYPDLCPLNNLENPENPGSPASPANLYHPGLLVKTKPLRPTADFITPLLSRGAAIKVLSPEWLAQAVGQGHLDAARLYE